ncbi:MAG: hypothetical protein M3Z35_15285 [Nitrospirota bacterium]|nr:hypothetical protein [Nitrospirota bacterium]
MRIPPSTYKVSARDITTVAAKTILVASTDLTTSQVYEIAEKLSEHIHDLLKTIPLNVSKVSGNPALFYPLHTGAIRFYDHNPPFFLDPNFLAGLGNLSLRRVC